MNKDLKDLLNSFFMLETLQAKLGLKFKDRVLKDQPYDEIQAIETLMGERNKINLKLMTNDLLNSEREAQGKRIAEIDKELSNKLTTLLPKYTKFLSNTFSAEEISQTFLDLNFLKDFDRIRDKELLAVAFN